jgi:predicted nucleic acid-binding protein
LKANGKTAVDTNAVIAYRAGVSEVCRPIKEAEVILVTAPVLGELLYGALNSQRIRENQEAVHKFLRCALFVPSDESYSYYLVTP